MPKKTKGKQSIMATSLAKQLKKLQIPGQFTHSGTQAASKKSFLFSCKDSASIDLDSVYWLGVNGLEELVSMDASFAQYTETLFSETSKDFERSILPLESAKKVDNEISGFLRLLSPYFLLRPAHKCLEWLVRVYEIHKCNVDALMECVLPYYETNLFVRVVQILDLDDHASSWAWLSPIQKEGVPLSRLSLVQHCLSDGPFLVFVCNMVVSSLSICRGDAPLASSHRVLVSFYVSTVCQVIQRGPVTEELVGRLLPFVAKGLGSLNVEYVSGTYMIVGVLGAKIQLSSKVVHSLIESIVMVSYV